MTAGPSADAGAEQLRAGDPWGAEATLQAALETRPHDARVRALLGEALLAQGRWDEGWPMMESRMDAPGMGAFRPPVVEPEWKGEPLAGKRLVIFGEQGAGDQIMFARFVPLAKALGAEVDLFCMPALQRLFARSLGVDVHAMAGSVETPDPDYWLLSGSLAHRFGATPLTLPSAPYLTAQPRAAGGRIGVTVAGNPNHRNDSQRSLPEAEARRVLGWPGTISLDPSATGARDFADTADIIAGLDLVITVDTSVAHLAGALGKPVWILLSRHGVDWRWGPEGSRTPWYPTARLFRQPAPGDWGSVLDIVEPALMRQLAAL